MSNSGKKGSFRSSRQDTAELDKSWFSDLEPPKVYNQKQASSKKGAKKKPAKNNAKRKTTSSSSKSSTFIEPPRKAPRQYGDGFNTSQSRNVVDNLTQAEKRAIQNKNRHRKNKLRKVLIWTLIVFLIIAVSVVLSLTVFFPINEIKISGNKQYTTKEISAICGIDINENLFLTDTDKASVKLEKELPYIYDAKITRQIPGTINIKVTETKPKYQIKNEDSYVLLDDNFKVLNKAGKKYSKAIVIKKAEVSVANEGSAVEFKGKTTAKYLTVLKSALSETKIENVTEIASVSAANNYIVYDGRITIKFGDTDNLEYKIYQSLATIDKLQDDNPNVKGTINATGDKSIYFTEK